VQLGIYQIAHFLNKIPNLPLRPYAEAFIRHVDKFPEIAGQIQRCGACVGEDIPGILVGDICFLELTIPSLTTFYAVLHVNVRDGIRGNITKPIFGAVSLTTLGEATMPVSYKLMGTGSGDTFDFEGKVDMLKHAVMTVSVKMLYQSHRVLGIAVIADGGDLSDGLHRIGSSLNQSDFHSHFSSVK
jgi:hypothetical protein